MDNDYRKAYDTAASELEQFLMQQEKMEQRILALRKTMNALYTLCQQEGLNTSEMDKRSAYLAEIVDSSVTKDILQIIAASRVPLTTSEVRAEMNKLGGSMAEHSNPLATINSVLNRLVEANKVEETVKDGRKAWRRKRIATVVKGLGAAHNGRL